MPHPVPDAVAYVRDLLDGFPRPWLLCGGWAADAHLGRRTRDHGDVDVAVFHHDQRALFTHMAGWTLVGHDPNVPDDTKEPWTGRRLDMPAHVHVVGATYEFEFLLNEATDTDWLLHRDLDIALPLDRAIAPSPWGMPMAAPEVILFFKAGGDLSLEQLRTLEKLFRQRDEDDFFALLPTLTATQRGWLRESIAKLRADHPWLPHLID